MPKSILHLLLVPILDVHSSLYQKRNICTCTFGYPAQGTQCDSNGENCASCWSEYELVGQSCQPAQNQCVCVTDGLIAGTPVGPEDCAADGENRCETCFSGFYKSSGRCFRNVCTCVGGTPASGTDCTTNGQAICASGGCNAGFQYINGECIELTCVCENNGISVGTPVSGVDCPANGFNICAECNENFHLKAGTCQPNVCNCSNGIAATDSECNENNSEICTSCDQGYSLESNVCTMNVCTCDNGSPRTGTGCLLITEKCNSCDAGFHLVNDLCETNICTCENGNFATGIECSEHGDEICSKCNAGFTLKNELCIENSCTCINGTGSTGTDCLIDQTPSCSECDVGFKGLSLTHSSQILFYYFLIIEKKFRLIKTKVLILLQNGNCVLNVCTCTNGIGATGEDCLADNDEKCSSCNTGYNLFSDFCIENTCTCNSGSAAVGIDCQTNGSETCSVCDPGYTLENNQCLENTCTCVGGSAAKGLECSVNNTEKCLSCEKGYTLINNRCIEHICVCTTDGKRSGTGAVGPSCPAPGEEFCESCDRGFTIRNNVCVENECVCEISGKNAGTPATGVDCEFQGANVCSKCDDGFYQVETACTKNLCTCLTDGVVSGIPAIGELCMANGTNVCGNCLLGYTLVGTNCVKNKCTCEHGTVLETCAVSGESCESCEVGYKIDLENSKCVKQNIICNDGEILNGVQCRMKKCVCSNGIAASGTACPVDGIEYCVGCNIGHALINQQCLVECRQFETRNFLARSLSCCPGVCVPTTCTCLNGSPTLTCPSNSIESCASCNFNYNLINQRCIKTGCADQNFCVNSGMCRIRSDGSEYCECSDGFRGKWCEQSPAINYRQPIVARVASCLSDVEADRLVNSIVLNFIGTTGKLTKEKVIRSPDCFSRSIRVVETTISMILEFYYDGPQGTENFSSLLRSLNDALSTSAKSLQYDTISFDFLQKLTIGFPETNSCENTRFEPCGKGKRCIDLPDTMGSQFFCEENICAADEYRENQFVCMKNKCTCRFGIPNDGSLCRNGSESCRSCNDGYLLFNGRCVDQFSNPMNPPNAGTFDDSQRLEDDIPQSAECGERRVRHSSGKCECMCSRIDPSLCFSGPGCLTYPLCGPNARMEWAVDDYFRCVCMEGYVGGMVNERLQGVYYKISKAKLLIIFFSNKTSCIVL